MTDTQNLLTQLNSSQAVSLPDFINAIELEPNLNLSTIFTGTAVSGNSINWKNIPDEAGSIKDYQYLLVSNTASWNFSLTKFNVTNPALHLSVDDTDETGSIVTAVITGQVSWGGVTIPVMIIKNEDYLSTYLYINNGTTTFYEYSFIESLLDTPLLREYYPDSMKSLTGINCLSLCLEYSMLDGVMETYRIKSPAQPWTPQETSIINFSDCSITCTVTLPYDEKSASFEVNGTMTYTCAATGSGSSTPTFGDMAFLFQNNGLSVLSNLSNVSGNLFNGLKDLYVSTADGIVSSINVISNQDSLNPVPPVILKRLNMIFYYSSEVCDLTGTVLAGSLAMDIKTMLNLKMDNPFTMLAFEMQDNTDNGVTFNLSDLSLFGLSIGNQIPGINGITFSIHDFNFWTEIQPSVNIIHAALTIGTAGSWQILPSVSVNKMMLNLNYSYGENINLYHGEVMGELIIGGNDVILSIAIPETGDWRMALNRIADELTSDQLNMLPSKEGLPGIPIPSIGDITSLIGFNFVNNLPSSLLFEGIELTGLTLTFPKPTAGVIHTASCSMKLTSDWSFTPLLTLSDIEFQCDMDFTGAQTVVDFEVAGTVTIASIDLPAYARRKGGTWIFGIADADLHFSLNDLLSVIPLTSGVSFPDFINDITDVSIKIGRLEMVYNSDMSQLIEYSFSIGLDKPWVIAQNIFELEELTVENRKWNLGSSPVSEEGRILCRLGVGSVDIPVQIPLPFNSEEWTMGIYEPVAIPSLADFVSLTGFNGTAWLSEIIGAVTPDMEVSRFDIKFDFDPFNITR